MEITMENENTISEQQTVVHQETAVIGNAKENTPKTKKFRIGWFFLALVPVIASFTLQSMAQSPFMLLASFELTKQGNTDITNTVGFTNDLMKIYSEKYATFGFILYGVLALVVFGIWYYKSYVRKHPKVPAKEVFSVKSVTGAIGITVALAFVYMAVITLILAFFPHALDSYAQMMESAGLGNDVLLTIAYVIILAPITEELCLRGLTYGYLEKSGLKPAATIVITSLIFGIMHLNLVQGIYAFIFGIALTYLRYKYRSIKISIFTHICFNLFGTYGFKLIDKMGLSNTIQYVIGGIALVVTVLCIALVKSDKKANKSIVAA